MWKIILKLAQAIFIVGFVSLIGIGGYFATHRPLTPDAAHGFVVWYKFTSRGVYITEWEHWLDNFIFGVVWFSGLFAAGAQIRLQK